MDTISFDGLFYAKEKIVIKANDSIVFQRVVDTTKDFQSVYGEFVLHKLDTVDLSIRTFFNGKSIIDTTFAIPPQIYINSIGGSICYPFNISEDSLRKIKQPHFGHIQIDSCKRYITLMPDSIVYKYPKY